MSTVSHPTNAVKTLRQTLNHKVEEIRHLTESTYVLRFTREGMTFTPGQHLCVGINDLHMREYSVYSANTQAYLEILIKTIEHGMVSNQLMRVRKGQTIACEGPFGYFTIEDDFFNHPLYFIATGTGIAPYHCFAQSYEGTAHPPWTILHGIRSPEERYEFLTYRESDIDYLPCYSRTLVDGMYEAHQYHDGRVTDYIAHATLPKDAYFFLCGNSDMIYQAYDLLQTKGYDSGRIKAEVYF